MSDLIFTQLSASDLKTLFRQTLEDFFKEMPAETEKEDEVGGIKLAEEVTKLKPSTIYALVSQRKIPHFKRGNRLYFSRQDILSWIAEGKRRTVPEMVGEVSNHSAIQATQISQSIVKRKN